MRQHISELASAFEGQALQVIGSGPSLARLEARHLKPGPVLAINTSITTIERLGLPEDTFVFSFQKDHAYADCKAPVIAHLPESGQDPNYGEYEFACSRDFDIPDNTPSAVACLYIANLMGCDRVDYWACDAMTGGDVSRYDGTKIYTPWNGENYRVHGHWVEEHSARMGLPIVWRKVPKEQLRILLVYPGHSFSTFDVANGYEKALRSLGHEVKSFDYHNWVTFYGKALQWWGQENPDFQPPDDNAHVVLASERVILDVLDFVPDVVLIITGTALHRRAYELIHRLEVPISLLLTESPYADEHQAKIIEKGHVSLAFANDKVSVERLPGKVAYLPHSYDPEIHHKRDGKMPWQGEDVFFYGTLWPERVALFESLNGLKSQYDILIDGINPAVKPGEEDTIHPKDNDELAWWYSATRIALNHHRTYSGVDDGGQAVHVTGAHSLGPRAYEIAACGAFQICDDSRPELAEVFGDSIPTYHDGASLRAQVEYFLNHDAEREHYASEAFLKVQPCSFLERARNIVIPQLQEVI